MKQLNVLFVCTGDTCRSPMASSIFAKKIRDSGILTIGCFSAGVSIAPRERAVNPFAQKALSVLGVPLSKHLATPLSIDLLSKAHIILTMTRAHKQLVFDKFGTSFADKIFSFGEFVGDCDVLDPYGQSEIVYLNCAKQLDAMTTVLLSKLRNIGF